MNTLYTSRLIEQRVSSRIESEDKDDAGETRGAVSATIHEILDRTARDYLPCNTHSLQLLFEGFQFFGCLP
jgi:hypothetical protein